MSITHNNIKFILNYLCQYVSYLLRHLQGTQVFHFWSVKLRTIFIKILDYKGTLFYTLEEKYLYGVKTAQKGRNVSQVIKNKCCVFLYDSH